MTDADLNKAIEVAEEAVAGFADDDSFEQLLALAVLELRERLNTERVTVADWIMHRGFATGHGDAIVDMLDELEWQVAEREREACAECGADGGHALYCVACAEKFIAQTETKDEPVATVISESGANVTHSWWHEPALPISTKLYTSPQRTWVGLTDEEQSFVYDQVKQIVGGNPFWVKFADAIETKLKEKNT